MLQPLLLFRLFSSLILFAFTLVSCGKKAEHDPYLPDYFKENPVVSIKGKVLPVKETAEMFFGKMLEMVYVDSMLIIRDIDLSHRMKIVDLNSNTLVKFGKIGDGPNELIGEYTRPSIDHENKLIYISDYPLYYVYSVDSLKKGNYTEPIRRLKIDMTEDNLIESTVSGGYVVGALFAKRFGLHRLSDREFTSMGDYEYGSYLSHQTVSYAHPSQRKAVMLDLFAEAFAILDYSHGNLSLIKDYKGWTSEHHEVEEAGGIVRVIPPQDDRNCFMSCATSEKYIYALYSGKLRSATFKQTSDPSYAETVYVFDWEGNPVKKLILDYPVRSIALDEENQVLYAGALIDKNPKLVKFDLR